MADPPYVQARQAAALAGVSTTQLDRLAALPPDDIRRLPPLPTSSSNRIWGRAQIEAWRARIDRAGVALLSTDTEEVA
jgi:hypothetical protein